MELNEKIARAMLMQCALVWEHCISASMPYLDAKFCLADVKRGAYGKTSDRQKSKIGMTGPTIKKISIYNADLQDLFPAMG